MYEIRKDGGGIALTEKPNYIRALIHISEPTRRTPN